MTDQAQLNNALGSIYDYFDDEYSSYSAFEVQLLNNRRVV